MIRAVAAAIAMAISAGAISGCRSLAGKSETAPFTTVDLTGPEMSQPLSAEHLDIGRLSTAVYHETNHVRHRLGLKPFKRLPKLDQAADLQASANALNQVAGHANIVRAWATPFDRVRKVGLRPSVVSENAGQLPLINLHPSHGYIERFTPDGSVILDASTGRKAVAHTYATFARAIVAAWMNSPGHRANIVNPDFEYVGCSNRPSRSIFGLDQITSIQVFYTPAGS